MPQWRDDNKYVSYLNWEKEVVKGQKLPKKVVFHDITLRDGEQQPGIVFRKKDKIDIAHLLAETGVQRIEMGMPAVSQEDKEAITQIAREDTGAEVYAFARCMVKDVDLALECDVDGVVMEVPSNKEFIDEAYKWSLEKAIKSSVDSTKYAAEHGLKVSFFTIDSSRADFDWWLKLIKEVSGQGHMDALVVVDTFGVLTPEATGYFVRRAKEAINKPIEIHAHNDFGLGTANSIAAVTNGAEVVHTTVNAIGERCGNASLEEIAMALKLLYNADIGLDTTRFYELSKLVQERSGVPMPGNKPVVGDNAFLVESGIIASWWKNVRDHKPTLMFPYHWKLVGQPAPRIMLGKKAGADNVLLNLQQTGVSLPEEKMLQLVNMVKQKGIDKKGAVSVEELLSMVEKVR